MIASAPPEHYRKAEEILLADENVDSLLVIFIPPIASDADEVAPGHRRGRPRRPQAGARDLHERQGSAAGPRAHSVLPVPRVGGDRAGAGRGVRGVAAPAASARSRRSRDSTRRRARAIVEHALERGGGWLPPTRDRGAPLGVRDPRRPHAPGAYGRRGRGGRARARLPGRAQGRRPGDPPQDRGRRRAARTSPTRPPSAARAAT